MILHTSKDSLNQCRCLGTIYSTYSADWSRYQCRSESSRYKNCLRTRQVSNFWYDFKPKKTTSYVHLFLRSMLTYLAAASQPLSNQEDQRNLLTSTQQKGFCTAMPQVPWDISQYTVSGCVHVISMVVESNYQLLTNDGRQNTQMCRDSEHWAVHHKY